jgi:hypothetical protein
LYTKAKDSLIEAYGGEDNLPKDFTSIRPNFIEQLKKGLDMDDEEEEEEEEQPEESEVVAQVIEYFEIYYYLFCCSFLASIIHW